MRFNPTVVLFVAVMTLFAGVLTLAILCPTPPGPVILGAAALQGIALCAAYTVAHDAAHHIASRRRALNEFMLIACGVLFLFEPYLFRRLHLTHHAHTDESDDPDLFTAGPNWFIRVARSSLLLAGYYLYAVRHWRREPRWRAHLLLGPLIPLLIGGAFFAAGKGMVFVALWAMPLLAAGAVLGMVLSSAPHDATTRTTRNLNVPAIARWLLGNGHLHLAHHLAPTVPWYRLPAFWRHYQTGLSAAQTPP